MLGERTGVCVKKHIDITHTQACLKPSQRRSRHTAMSKDGLQERSENPIEKERGTIVAPDFGVTVSTAQK